MTRLQHVRDWALLSTAALATIAIVASGGFSNEALAAAKESLGDASCTWTCTAQPDGLGNGYSWRDQAPYNSCPAGTGCSEPTTSCGSPNVGASAQVACTPN